MPVNKKATVSKKELKKQKVDQVTAMLTPALSKLKKDIGEKKFDKKIRKAAKLFADELLVKAKTKPATKAVAGKAKKAKTGLSK